MSADRETLAEAVRAGLGCHRQDDITEPDDGAGEEYSVCDEHDEDWPCAVAERVVDALLAGPLTETSAGRHVWWRISGSEAACGRCHVVARATAEDEIIAADGGSFVQPCVGGVS